MSIKAFRFHLYTTRGIERTLRRYLGSCRLVRNAAIAEQRRRRKAGANFAAYAATCRCLTD